ncbi:MAG: CopG family transcriptional regulator [Chloroflexi bacterium]|nr:CopG family transcriptional regulator [Chloroflexota bacterium]
MTVRATFTLEEEIMTFLKQVAGSNRSAYVNQLLNTERQRLLEADILKANLEEANDENYQAELTDWDVVLEDGLTP